MHTWCFIVYEWSIWVELDSVIKSGGVCFWICHNWNKITRKSLFHFLIDIQYQWTESQLPTFRNCFYRVNWRKRENFEQLVWDRGSSLCRSVDWNKTTRSSKQVTDQSQRTVNKHQKGFSLYYQKIGPCFVQINRIALLAKTLELCTKVESKYFTSIEMMFR